MVKFANRIPLESIVLVEGEVQKPVEPLKSCTVTDAEIRIDKLHVVSEAQEKLPFGLEDASRPADLEAAATEPDAHFVTVAIDTRLNNRVLDLRVRPSFLSNLGRALKCPQTPVNLAIFRIQSKVSSLFRDFLLSQDFLEIHSPKLQGTATESGASVFEVKYFDTKAFLAQSPQLHKQMCIAADFGRVFEITPVFRAENANTARHLSPSPPLLVCVDVADLALGQPSSPASTSRWHCRSITTRPSTCSTPSSSTSSAV